MSIEEIIEALSLDEEAYRKAANEQVAQSGYKDGWLKRASILHDAIELLKTHPEAQTAEAGPRKPIDWCELREWVGTHVFAEFLTGRVSNGYYKVARFNHKGVAFANDTGRVVRVILAKEYGKDCLAYVPMEGEL